MNPDEDVCDLILLENIQPCFAQYFIQNFQKRYFYSDFYIFIIISHVHQCIFI